MAIIRSNAQLREVIGEKIPGLEAKVSDRLDEFTRAYIEKSPFLILSTADAEGRCDASPKGDAPGFVEVVDDRTLIIPDRPGNKLAYGHENVLTNPHIGLLFMIPGTSETLRINGTAELDTSEELGTQLSARGKPAVIAIRVTIEECFFHCAKAFIRSGLWQPETWSETPHRVSFGKIMAKRENLPEETARALDEAIETDYKTNL